MKCKNCGAEIDESLETCPECNAPLSFIPIIPEEENLKDVINPKIIRAIIVIILVLAIFGLIAALILFQLDIIGPESALWAGGKKSSSKISSQTAVADPDFNSNIISNTESFIENENDFIKETSEIIDISSYVSGEYKGKLAFILEEYQNDSIEKSISIGEKKLELPCSYEDIIEKGWALADENSDVGIYGTGSFNFKNESGDDITIWFQSDSGEKDSIENCTAITYSIGYFTESNPNFTYSGISEISGYKEVLMTLGEPQIISYSEELSEAYLIYETETSDALYRAQLCFDIKSDRIKTLDIYYFNTME